MLDRLARSCSALWLATAFVGALPAQGSDLLERAGKHFRVVFHSGDLPAEAANELLAEALARVEGLWPLLQKQLGARGKEVHTLHLYRDERVYREAERTLSPIPSVGLEAFATEAAGAHVLLWPALPAELLSRTGLPPPTAAELLRVAAELVVAPMVADIDEDGWFRWLLVIGMLESASNPEHAPGVDAAHDGRRAWFVRLREQKSEVTLENLLNPRLGFANRTDWDYAMAGFAVLAQTLEDRSAGWAGKVLGVKKAVKSMTDKIDRRRAAVAAVLGGNRTKAEARFQELLAAVAPTWEVRRPVWKPGDRGLLVGTAAAPASIVSVGALPEGDYVVAGRMELGVGGGSDAVITFGWDGQTHVDISFQERVVDVRVWTAKSDSRDSKARGDAPIQAGKPFDFHIEVLASEMAVVVDGKLVCSWQHGGRESHGYVSVNVRDRLLWLENLRVAPLPAGRGR